MLKPYSIAILAGGQSRRMGQNKALIKLGGTTVLQRVIDVAKPLSDDLFLVTTTPSVYAQFQLPMVADIVPNMAALGGIYTALKHACNPWTLVLACDMPFLNLKVIRHMAEYLKMDLDIVCASLEHTTAETDGTISGSLSETQEMHHNTSGFIQRPEPLHAFYNQSCLPIIEGQMAVNQLKIATFFGKVRTRYLWQKDFDGIVSDMAFLLNMNTPEDLAKANALLQAETA